MEVPKLQESLVHPMNRLNSNSRVSSPHPLLFTVSSPREAPIPPVPSMLLKKSDKLGNDIQKTSDFHFGIGQSNNNYHHSSSQPPRWTSAGSNPNPNSFTFISTPPSVNKNITNICNSTETRVTFISRDDDFLADKASRRISIPLFETNEADPDSYPYLQTSSATTSRSSSFSNDNDNDNICKQHEPSIVSSKDPNITKSEVNRPGHLADSKYNSHQPFNKPIQAGLESISDFSTSSQRNSFTQKRNSMSFSSQPTSVSPELFSTGCKSLKTSSARVVHNPPNTTKPSSLPPSSSPFTCSLSTKHAQNRSKISQSTSPMNLSHSLNSSIRSNSFSSPQKTPSPIKSPISSMRMDIYQKPVRRTVDQYPQSRLVASSVSNGLDESMYNPQPSHQHHPSQQQQQNHPYQSQQQQQYDKFQDSSQGFQQDRQASLHRHAVSNASFDFGLMENKYLTTNSMPNTNPITETIPIPAIPYTNNNNNNTNATQPPIIRPQPVRQPFTFQDPPTFQDISGKPSTPSTMSIPRTSPSLQQQQYNQQQSPMVKRTQTSVSQPSQLHSRSSSVRSNQSNQLKPLTSAPNHHYHHSHEYNNNITSYSSSASLARKISSSSSITTPSYSHNHHRFSISSTATAAANIVPNIKEGQQYQHQNQNQQQACYSPQQQRHSRLNSTSSRFSLSSASSESMPSHSRNSGCFYVRELKRRAATLWCDIPPSVWGLPIGLVDTTQLSLHASPNGTYVVGPINASNRSSSFSSSHSSAYPNSSGSIIGNGSGANGSGGSGSGSGTSVGVGVGNGGSHFFPGTNISNGSKSKSFNESVDIRHSHLTPRLLASEVGDDADDYAVISNGRIVNTSTGVNINHNSSSNNNHFAGTGYQFASTKSSTLPENEVIGGDYTFDSAPAVDIDRYASTASATSAISAQSRKSVQSAYSRRSRRSDMSNMSNVSENSRFNESFDSGSTVNNNKNNSACNNNNTSNITNNNGANGHGNVDGSRNVGAKKDTDTKSIASIEEDVGKIKLFVMNPDASSSSESDSEYDNSD